MRCEFQLHGVMPLLMHADNIEGAEIVKEWRADPSNKNQSVPGDDRSPAWTWQTYLYTDGVHITIPQENVMAALMTGGSQLVLRRQKTFKELSQSGILMESEHCEFFCRNKNVPMAAISKMRDMSFVDQMRAAKELGFSLFAKRARVGSSKHVRVRARFDEWSVRGTFTAISKDLTLDILQQIFSLAGRAGIGDWRPSSPRKPGPWGMFEARVEKA